MITATKEVTNLPIEDFSAGQRTTGTFYSRVPSSPRCQNMVSYIDKLLRKRPGFQTVNIPAQGTAEVTGLYEFKLDSTSSFQIMHTGETVYKMDNFDKVWDSLQTGISVGATSEFATFQTGTQKYLLHCTHNNDTLKVWDGATASMTVLSADGAPQPKYIISWNNHLFAAGIIGHESRIRWSNLATYDNWQTNGVDNYDDNCQTGDGDYITGLGALRGNLYVFKRYSIFQVTYLGGSPLIQVRKVVDNIGAISNKTICSAKITQTALDGTVSKYEVLLFLTPDRKIVAFDGQYTYTLTDGMYESNDYANIYMQNMNEGLLPETHAIYYEPENLYILFFAGCGSSTINNAICLNMVSKGMWPWTNMPFRSSALWTGGLNYKVPYVGNYDGDVFRTLYGAKDIIGGVDTDIESYYETDLIDAKRPDVMKKGRYLTVYLKPRSNTTITLSRATGWVPSFREERSYQYTQGNPLGVFTLGSTGDTLGVDFGAPLYYDVPENQGQIRFRIYEKSKLESFVIHRIDFTEGHQGLGTTQTGGVTVT
jgi:hypothetical protein